VSALCFLSLTEGGGQGRDWVQVCGSGARRRACGVDLGVVALERCLTISSEERETWTAASLRGSWVTGGPEETS
jgi:hypothetical protein